MEHHGEIVALQTMYNEDEDDRMRTAGIRKGDRMLSRSGRRWWWCEVGYIEIVRGW